MHLLFSNPIHGKLDLLVGNLKRLPTVGKVVGKPLGLDVGTIVGS